MEQFIFDAKHIVEAVVYTLDKVEVIKMLDRGGVGDKCQLYYF